MQKGQAAVELLIILAVSMVVLIAIYGYSSTSMAELNRQKIVDDAQTSVKTLAMSADDVYRQGVGARKQVFYSVPSGVNESLSGIEDNSFVLNVLGSDVFGKPEVCLLGEIPIEQGGHLVWMTAQEQCVFIGTESISIDKTSSYVTLTQSDSGEDTITITNGGSSTATIFLVETWAHANVSLGLSTASFALAAGDSQEVTLTYTSTATASGNYPGSLSVGAHFDSGDENVLVPLNAEIASLETDLILFPTAYSFTLRENDVQTSDLNVCNNNPDSALTSISFTDSGDIASWIGAISTIPSLAAGICNSAPFTITVPNEQSYGTFTGTITAVDSASNTDSTEITIDVPGMSTDFVFDWSTAQFTPTGKRLWEWTMQNTGSDTITIDKMTITWFNDLDNSTLEEIRLNVESVWSAGGGTSGQEIDVTNFSINSGVSYSSGNRFEFSGRMNDDSEDFQILFEFTDGSTYTTALYQP